MKLYLLAALLFALAAYLWLTPPPVEPLNLTPGREVTVEEYRGDAPASSGEFQGNNAKQQPPSCDPCAKLGGQRLNEEPAVFDGAQCTRGSEYNCRVAAEHWRCLVREQAKTWGVK